MAYKKFSTKGISLLVVIAVIIFLLYPLNNFLSINSPIEAKLLIVEGWMPDIALASVSEKINNKKYNKIITTGLDAPDYYPLTMNGIISFYIKEQQLNKIRNGEHKISIKLYGETKGKNRAHFNVFINDSLAGNFYANARKRKYTVKWKGDISDLDSVTIQFDNDKIGSFGDRNLYIKEINIDNNFVIPYMNNTVYYVNTTDRKEKRVNNYSSYAEIARNKLISFGIDSTRIVAVPGNNTSINRTISSAIAVRDYLKLSDIEDNSVNVVSIGPHARRSWMTYKQLLGSNFEIGIISIQPQQINYTKRWVLFNVAYETVGNIYYWLKFLFK